MIHRLWQREVYEGPGRVGELRHKEQSADFNNTEPLWIQDVVSVIIAMLCKEGEQQAATGENRSRLRKEARFCSDFGFMFRRSLLFADVLFFGCLMFFSLRSQSSFDIGRRNKELVFPKLISPSKSGMPALRCLIEISPLYSRPIYTQWQSAGATGRWHHSNQKKNMLPAHLNLLWKEPSLLTT